MEEDTTSQRTWVASRSWKSQAKKFFPRASSWRSNPANINFSPVIPMLDFWSWNFKIIKFCCFIPRNLWSFISAAIETYFVKKTSLSVFAWVAQVFALLACWRTSFYFILYPTHLMPISWKNTPCIRWLKIHLSNPTVSYLGLSHRSSLSWALCFHYEGVPPHPHPTICLQT